jgi:hypothetical protein
MRVKAKNLVAVVVAVGIQIQAYPGYWRTEANKA